MLSALIQQEEKRQQETVNLIASENYPSEAVRAAVGSVLSSKYAEGYPGKRYYSGTKVVDEIETSVQDLARKVFATDYHVNVQPYSGSVANLAAYLSFMQPGEPIMSLDLAHGGHLSHGHKVNFVGKLFDRYAYFVKADSHRLDYDTIEEEAKELKPKIIVSGASAYSRQIDFKRISDIAHSVGARHLADISHISGLVATGLHTSPFDHADYVMTTTHKLLRGPRGALLFCKEEFAKEIDKSVFPGLQGGPHMNTIAGIGVCLEEALKPEYKIYCQQVIKNAQALASELLKLGLKVITEGTDNHLFLVDLRPLKISGQEAQDRLESIGITVNKNAIPYDEAPPQNPSGIRIGTPAITTRGLTEKDLPALAKKVAEALKQ
ncbi:MAG: serine hydroxymethyltransferase [Patescibacteria group bacterium]